MNNKEKEHDRQCWAEVRKLFKDLKIDSNYDSLFEIPETSAQKAMKTKNKQGEIICVGCKKRKKPKAGGYCAPCYLKEWRRRKKLYKIANEMLGY